MYNNENILAISYQGLIPESMSNLNVAKKDAFSFLILIVIIICSSNEDSARAQLNLCHEMPQNVSSILTARPSSIAGTIGAHALKKLQQLEPAHRCTQSVRRSNSES
jgi:hypothetical protein